MRMQLMPERLLGINPVQIDHGISNGKWLESVVRELVDPSLTPSVPSFDPAVDSDSDPDSDSDFQAVFAQPFDVKPESCMNFIHGY